MLVLAVLIAGGIIAWRSSSNGSVSTASLSRQERQEARGKRAGRARRGATGVASGDVEGRGTAVSGDTLRVARTTVRLTGIEAPEPDQMCTDADGPPTGRADEAAKQALARLLRDGRVTCDVRGVRTTTALATARSEIRTSRAELVRGGHVFATTGLFAAYGGIEERGARRARSACGPATATRPSDYRAQKWEEAKREAPDGCPIKGSVRGSRRYLRRAVGARLRAGAREPQTAASAGSAPRRKRRKPASSRSSSPNPASLEKESPRSGGRARAAMRDAA